MEADVNRYKALVLRVVDGDTIKVAIDLGFNIVLQTKIRLAGIDSAELRDKATQEKAEAAKKYVEEHLLSKEIILKSLKTEKYGRYLAFIYFEGEKESFNDRMVREGFATMYDKGKLIKNKNNEKSNKNG
jgi:micrococcal nuclease